MLEKTGAKVSRVRSLKGFREAIAAQLRENKLPPRVRLGADPIFDACVRSRAFWRFCGACRGERHGWPKPRHRRCRRNRHALSRFRRGKSLDAKLLARNPRHRNFASDIVGSYEEGWAKLRSLYGSGNMPRTVNLISGPSRTADIEQTIVMGAHGPRNLLVLIAGS